MLNRILLVIGIVLFFSISTYANTATTNKNSAPLDKAELNKALTQLVNNAEQKVNFGISIRELDNDRILYQHNEQQLFNPASTLKTFTAIAALAYLGPDYHFVTEFLANTAITQAGILDGDLYLKFTGDPELATTDLANLVTTLAQHNLREIKGNLVIDDTRLDRVNYATGWMWDEEQICYAAPATAIIINKNCFAANLTPSKQLNTNANVAIVPTLANVKIINRTITKSAQSWECPLKLTMKRDNTYVLTGCVALNEPPLPLAIAFANPRMAAESTLLALLKQHNILLTGKVIFAKSPTAATVLAQHNSLPLSALVTIMLKQSDNLIADVLSRTIGAKYFNTTGTWENGVAAMRALLAPTTGIEFDKLVMVDGSGLSRYDLVSPAQFMQLLTYAYHHLASYPIFYQALPISGIDGTLEDRFKDGMTGKIHAKTGGMTSVGGLVGYTHSANSKPIVFAILVNGFIGKSKVVSKVEDNICKLLVTSNL